MCGVRREHAHADDALDQGDSDWHCHESATRWSLCRSQWREVGVEQRRNAEIIADHRPTLLIYHENAARSVENRAIVCEI